MLTPEQRELLQIFERELDPQDPENSRIAARILGYGEISTVIRIQDARMDGLAFKRLPLFRDANEVERYCAVFDEYQRVLEEIDVRLPAQSHAVAQNGSGVPVLYIVQQELSAASIGGRAIHVLPDDGITILVRRVLQELHKAYVFNQQQTKIQIALDGQISNWAIDDFDGKHLPETFSLHYVDTSTPLLRVNGVEQLDTELFLRSAPSFLAWVLRKFYLADVVARYYDFHRVAVDLVANFYKEQRADRVPAVVQTVNTFFENDARDLNIAPLSEKEVRDYYREDAQIWSLYFNARKLDRRLRMRVLRQSYPYILPKKIQR